MLASDKPVRGEIKYEVKKGWFSKELVRKKVEAYPTELGHRKISTTPYTDSLRYVIIDAFEDAARKIGMFKSDLKYKLFGVEQAVRRSPIGAWDREGRTPSRGMWKKHKNIR